MTQAQYKLLTYIIDYIEKRGYSPSFTDMTRAMNCRSKSNIARLVSGLKASGFLRTRFAAARSIEVLKKPHVISTITEVVVINRPTKGR